MSHFHQFYQSLLKFQSRALQIMTSYAESVLANQSCMTPQHMTRINQTEP